MLSCKDIAGLAARDELSEAGWRGRLAARLHLLMCQHCRRYAAQLRIIGQAAWSPARRDRRRGIGRPCVDSSRACWTGSASAARSLRRMRFGS